jgi:hypothetical protein
VQIIDRKAMGRDIQYLQEAIDSHHARLSKLTYELEGWALKNLEQIILDDEKVFPQEAAREVVSNLDDAERIPDAIGIGQEFRPQFGDADVASLREARRVLGKDLEYIDKPLPDISEFPASSILVQSHRDLAQYTTLTDDIESGRVPALIDSSEGTLALLHTALIRTESLRKVDGELSKPGFEWAVFLRTKLSTREDETILDTLEKLGSEMTNRAKTRNLRFKTGECALWD